MQTTTRRQLVKRACQLSLGIPLLAAGLSSCGGPDTVPEAGVSSTEDTSSPLRILILGGTSFLGPHQVAYALGRGHKVSTFTRGLTKPTIHTKLFDQVEMLIGDREDNLSALENREWDVVIDNSGHNVDWTTRTAELLKDKVSLYLYTSSTGVYYPYLGDNIDETTKTLTKEPSEIANEVEEIEYWYGVMKTNSEIAAKTAFGEDRTLVVRPTYMIGPGDKSDRFIYWPIRLARGGELLLPGKAEDPMQYIDVRDVAEWMIRLAETNTTGTFNAVGPEQPETNAQFGAKATAVFDVPSTIVQVDDYDFLLAEKIPDLVPWIMPAGNNYGSARVSNRKALATGLTCRSLAASIKDTHSWWYSDALTDERRAEYENKEDGPLAREAAILSRWKKREG